MDYEYSIRPLHLWQMISLRESEISNMHDSFPGDEIIMLKNINILNGFIQFLTAHIKIFTDFLNILITCFYLK